MSKSKKEIMRRVRNTAGGNSDVRMKDLCCDILNAEPKSKGYLKRISEQTFLCEQTLQRVMENPDGYRPQSDTMERIINYADKRIVLEDVKIQKRYKNQPKKETTEDV